MSKKRHHYVPRFYLRGFSSATNRINVYNLERRLPIRDASLRDQCYRHRFYGTDDVENSLSTIEAEIAPVLQEIRMSNRLPHYGSASWETLVFFIALQETRTALRAKLFETGFTEMMRMVLGKSTGHKEIDFNDVTLSLKNIGLWSLQFVPAIYSTLTDLRGHLAYVTKRSAFVTSDNPVFKYNLYCENVKGIGTTGTLARGLLVFMPISPRHVVILYDDEIYNVGTGHRSFTKNPPASDIFAINLLQVVSAEANLYYDEWRMTNKIGRVIEEAQRFLPENRVIVEEFVEFGREDESSLIHQFEPSPNLRLKLSFFSLKSSALKIPLNERVRLYRRELPGFEDSVPRPSNLSGTARFVRRK